MRQCKLPCGTSALAITGDKSPQRSLTLGAHVKLRHLKSGRGEKFENRLLGPTILFTHIHAILGFLSTLMVSKL